MGILSQLGKSNCIHILFRQRFCVPGISDSQCEGQMENSTFEPIKSPRDQPFILIAF